MKETPLLIDTLALELESISSKETQVVLVVKTIQSAVPCPCCHQASSRIHSRYKRTVADLPWQSVTVQIELLTRRFFCINKTCRRRIFGERLPRVVAAYGRQTMRLNNALHLIGDQAGWSSWCKVSALVGNACQSGYVDKAHSSKSVTC